MKSHKGWLYGVSVAVASGLLLEWLTPSSSWIKSVWIWLVGLCSSAWAWLLDTSALPNWLLYGLLMILLISLIGQYKTFIRNPNRVAFGSYTEDRFKGVLWRWTYRSSRIIDPVPYCPTCDMCLVHWQESHLSGRSLMYEPVTHVYCENCGGEALLSQPGTYDELVQEIVRLVDRKLRTGEWKAVVFGHESDV